LTAQATLKQEEFSWKSLKFKGRDPDDDSLSSDSVAVAMGKYIVCFTPERVVLDTKKRVCYGLRLPATKIYDFEAFTAIHWKDNKIIIVGSERRAEDRCNFHFEIFTILVPPEKEQTEEDDEEDEDEEIIEAEYDELPVNLELDTKCLTTHLHNNKLYIVARYNEIQRFTSTDITKLFMIDLETHQLVEGFACNSTLNHMSYLYENQIHIHFRGAPNDDAIKEEIIVNIEKYYRTNKENVVSFDSEIRRHSDVFPLNYYFFQYQFANGKLYGFIHSDTVDPNYETLHIYDMKTNIWEKHEIAGKTPQVDAPSVNMNGSVIILDNCLYLLEGRRNRVQCLSLGSLSSVTEEIIKPKFKSPEPSKLSSLLKNFLSQAPHHDITFEVESELIPAHKWWLTQRSKYFANMFSSGMLETQSDKIVISDVKATTFKAFLEFLYSDQIDLDEELAFDLIQQADKYSIPDLKRLCEECLSVYISPDNCARIANLAELLDAASLRDATVAFIAKNIKELKERSDFAEISNNMLKDVIIKITVR